MPARSAIADLARTGRDAARSALAAPERWSLHGRRPRADPAWYLGRGARSDATGLVVGGASRSGTTLFRVMLDTHPAVACGPESALFLPELNEGQLHRFYGVSRRDIRAIEQEADGFPQFAAAFLRRHAAREGKELWAEKTPRNVLNLGWILDRFPNVVFCHVVRDGRAVVNSLRTHPRFHLRGGRRVPTGIVNDLDRCIDQWLQEVGAGLRFDTHPRVVRVRYEDVVADAEAAFAPVLDELGLAWSPAMAEYHTVRSTGRSVEGLWQNPEAAEPLRDTSLDRWRTDLTADQVARIEERAGDMLAQLGYS